MNGPVALVLGATGQDGQLLATTLVAQGMRVVGTHRAHAHDRLPSTDPAVTWMPFEVQPEADFDDLLRQVQPAEIYNVAARTTGAGMFDDPVAVGRVNGLAVASLLDSIRRVVRAARFCQASSSEMFGHVTTSPQDESTPLRPRTPYGAAKAYAHQMVGIYREHYGIHAASAILYNHESPLRPATFVSRKITLAAARIRCGLTDELTLGDLDAVRDWGAAQDHARAMTLMLRAERPQDFVIATGRLHSVRELCEVAFSAVGLDYRKHVRTEPHLGRFAEPVPLVGDASKAREQLGWEPSITFDDMVRDMVNADLELIRRGAAASEELRW